MKRKLILVNITVLLLLVTTGRAQNKTQAAPLTADSLAAGNYKDVFKSFFQLAFNHFTSNNKDIQFTSNPFAVMAKMDSTLLKSTNYLNYTHLRNLNFSFSAKLDSAYKFNGFSSGIKYAIINKRDETVSNAFLILATTADSAYTRLFNSGFGVVMRDTALNRQWNEYFSGARKFKQLDPSLQKIVRDSAGKQLLKLLEDNGNWDIHSTEVKLYDSLRNKFHERGLWTVALSDTTYKNQFFFSNVLLSTEYLKGLDNPTKPLRAFGVEFNTKLSYNFIDDSLKSGRDLHRQILQLEPGFNFVIRNKNTLYSFAEFKLSGSYYHISSGSYIGEKSDSITLNATLRIRIINDIWVPLEIKYDPRSGNILGFLDVRANFSALKKLITSK